VLGLLPLTLVTVEREFSFARRLAGIITGGSNNEDTEKED